MENNNNLLIAVFMGWKPKDGGFIEEYGAWANDENGFKYDTDWNQLMQVVEKIGQLSLNEKGNRFTVEFSSFLDNDIQAVYNDVCDFITWFNKKGK